LHNYAISGQYYKLYIEGHASLHLPLICLGLPKSAVVEYMMSCPAPVPRQSETAPGSPEPSPPPRPKVPRSSPGKAQRGPPREVHRHRRFRVCKPFHHGHRRVPPRRGPHERSTDTAGSGWQALSPRPLSGFPPRRQSPPSPPSKSRFPPGPESTEKPQLTRPRRPPAV